MRKIGDGRGSRDGTVAALYRDSSDHALADYPRPSVAVDTAVLTLEPDSDRTPGLSVLQIRRGTSHQHGVWALPGAFLHEGERLRDAVDRSLRAKAGVGVEHPHQLHVFDAPGRDERGWVLSVAHVAVVPFELLATALQEGESLRLAAASNPGQLPYDHNDIVDRAVDHLRDRYATAPDPDRLLPDTFTLRELRLVHEAVAGHPLQRDTFRRAVETDLEPTGQLSSGTRGRPAELFRRPPQRGSPEKAEH
jgi:8-oxo-dGTP diphosphatase